MIPDWIRPILSRVVGLAVASLVTWLATKYGIVVPEDAKTQITEGTVVALMALFGTVYALVHRGVSIQTNPTDAAKPSVAKSETAEIKAETAELKAQSK
jgi:hypothetical protein